MPVATTASDRDSNSEKHICGTKHMKNSFKKIIHIID
uniref:Uncharacterized protein n=1 Tax=Anguilla anguilla TaxID=7936 RepID=A0A0E9RF74_ANGAN